MIPDAAAADRSRLVLLASIGGIAHGKALAPGSVVDAAQRIRGHAVNRLQAVDELLLTRTLEAKREAEFISLGKINSGLQKNLHGKPICISGQPMEGTMRFYYFVAMIMSPTALVRLPFPAKILEV